VSDAKSEELDDISMSELPDFPDDIDDDDISVSDESAS